jgi:hypothetical protein
VNGSPRLIVALLMSLIAPQLLTAQAKELERVGTAVVSEAVGPPVHISAGLRIVSARSTLRLNWIMINDPSLSIIFDGLVGAQGTFQDDWFRYAADLRMHALAPVTAFEVRVITFDVWNNFTGTLAFSQLEDLKANQKKNFGRWWGLLSESDVRDHCTSITYIAKVKLSDGKVIIADPTPALRAAQRIQEKVTLQDLEPRKEPTRVT